MVISWIFNSISRDLVDGFMFTSSARALWKELEQRFGGSNGPLIYQLKRDINVLRQGSLFVAIYFTKLKRLWDELVYMCPLSICTCEASEMCVCLCVKKAYDSYNVDLLVQFLTGLRDEYSHVRHQILLLDPLPNIHKAYSMIQNVEKQKEVYSDVSQLEIVAHTSHTKFAATPSSTSTRGQKRDSGNKADRFCTHYNKLGHEKDTCFKLHGYLEWFQDFKNKKKVKFSKLKANCVSYSTDTPMDFSDSEAYENKENHNSANFSMPPGFAQLVQNEVQKLMKSKGKMNHGDDGTSSSPTPFANFSGFAGPTY